MRSCFVTTVAIVALATAALMRTNRDVSAQVNPPPAATIADAWWYSGEGAQKSNESSQRTGAGPEDGTFFAYTGTVTNRGSYKDAWTFYAKKCGAHERFDNSPRTIGRPSVAKGYYTIFQRTDGGRNTTTFASHEKGATVTVHLHELEATPENTALQLAVVVARH
jgi:hypothetical protein